MVFQPVELVFRVPRRKRGHVLPKRTNGGSALRAAAVVRPATGGWLSPDPVESERRCPYVTQQPTTHTDPSGMQLGPGVGRGAKEVIAPQDEVDVLGFIATHGLPLCPAAGVLTPRDGAAAAVQTSAPSRRHPPLG